LTCMPELSQENYDDSHDEADTASWKRISRDTSAEESSRGGEFATCKAMFLPGRLCRSFTFISYGENCSGPETLSTLFTGNVNLTKTFELISSVLMAAGLSWTDVFVSFSTES
jgi:hypothetical protein